MAASLAQPGGTRSPVICRGFVAMRFRPGKTPFAISYFTKRTYRFRKCHSWMSPFPFLGPRTVDVTFSGSCSMQHRGVIPPPLTSALMSLAPLMQGNPHSPHATACGSRRGLVASAVAGPITRGSGIILLQGLDNCPSWGMISFVRGRGCPIEVLG